MNKLKDLFLNLQGLDPKVLLKLLETAKNSVNDGAQQADKMFKKDSGLFEYRGLKPLYMTSLIKKMFKVNYTSNDLSTKVKHLKSHGADYFMFAGDFLLCFKKMDVKSRVSGFYSKRFKEIMKGNLVHYSLTMRRQLAELEISKPLPIYYIGHVLDKYGRLADIRIVHYADGKVAQALSLKDMFAETLFTLNNNNEIVVTPKRNRKNSKQNDSDQNGEVAI